MTRIIVCREQHIFLCNEQSNIKKMIRKILLACGILSSLFYVAMNIFVAMQYEGYNSASQTVSELSADG